MSESSFEEHDLTPLVAAYTSAERRANVATQLRDRLGRWQEMGRSNKFKYKRSNGGVGTATGKFVGAVPNRPGYGLIMVEGSQDPELADGVYEVNMNAAQQVLAQLSAESLRKAGVTKSGHDVNGNPIGEVLDEDIEPIAQMNRQDITDLDRQLANGELSTEEQEAVQRNREAAPAHQSRNVVAEADATQEDLGEGYKKLQEALGRPSEEPIEVRYAPGRFNPPPAIAVDERQLDVPTERPAGVSPNAKYEKGVRQYGGRWDPFDYWVNPDGTRVPVRVEPDLEIPGQEKKPIAITPSEADSEGAKPQAPASRSRRRKDTSRARVPEFDVVAKRDELKKILAARSREYARNQQLRGRIIQTRATREALAQSNRVLSHLYKESDRVHKELSEALKTSDFMNLSDSELRRKYIDAQEVFAKESFDDNPDRVKDPSSEHIPSEAQTQLDVARETLQERGITPADEVIKNRLKESLSKFDNDKKDLAKLIDSGASGAEIMDWMKTNSPEWNSAEADLDTAWAVDNPSQEQATEWAKLQRAREFLNNYPGGASTTPSDTTPPTAGDAPPPVSPIQVPDISRPWDKDKVYSLIARKLGISREALEEAALGNGTEDERRIADAIEYFGDLIDGAKESYPTSPSFATDMYKGLHDALVAQIDSKESGTPPSRGDLTAYGWFTEMLKEGGATRDLVTGENVTEGIAVALGDKGDEVPEAIFYNRELANLAIADFINKNNLDFERNGKKLGIWINTDSGEVALDVVSIFDENSPEERERAIKSGEDNNQIEIYAIGAQESIPTGGSGNRGRAREQREAARLAKARGQEPANSSRPEQGGLEQPVDAGEIGPSRPDLPGGDGQHPEEDNVDLSGDSLTREALEILNDPLVKQEVDSSLIEEAREALENNDSSGFFKSLRKILGDITDAFYVDGLQGALTTQVRSIIGKIHSLRDRAKNFIDAVSSNDNRPSSLSREEIAPEIEVPQNIVPEILREVYGGERDIDFDNLTTGQAKLLNKLIDRRNKALIALSADLENDNVTVGQSNNYIIAKILNQKIEEFGEEIERSGPSANFFSGIENRLKNLVVVEEEYADIDEGEDAGRKVLMRSKMLAVAKSGEIYWLKWDWNKKFITVRLVAPDGSAVGEGDRDIDPIGSQSLIGRWNGDDNPADWHHDPTASGMEVIDRKVGNEYPVTPGMLSVNYDYQGEGLGGILSLATQFVVEASGREFRHSWRLLGPGNRNSKYTNPHDPDLHHPSQQEKLMETRGSKVITWLAELGWIGDRGVLIDDINSPEGYKRDFERFTYSLEDDDMENDDTEGPLWHLNNLLKKHADFYGPYKRANLIDPPELYKDYIDRGSRGEIGVNPEFDVLDIMKRLAFGDSTKEQTLEELRKISTNLEEANNQDWQGANLAWAGKSEEEIKLAGKVLKGYIDQLIEKVESEDWDPEVDALSKRKVDAVTEVRRADLGLKGPDPIKIKVDGTNFELDLDENRSLSTRELARAAQLATDYRVQDLREILLDYIQDVKNDDRKRVRDPNNDWLSLIEDGVFENDPATFLDVYNAFVHMAGAKAANRYMAMLIDNESGSKYAEQLEGQRNDAREQLTEALASILPDLAINIPPVDREIGGGASTLENGDTIIYAGGPSLIYEEDISPNDLSARIFPTVRLDNLGIRSTTDPENIVLRLDEPSQPPTVSEEDWRNNGAASDDPRVVARNFSTSLLRDAYYKILLNAHQNKENLKIVLQYQNGTRVAVPHTVIRDALQMQGYDIGKWLDSRLGGRDYLLTRYPLEGTIVNQMDNGSIAAREIDFGEGRDPIIAKTYAGDSNDVLSEVYTSPNEGEGRLLGRIMKNEDGDYVVILAEQNGDFPPSEEIDLDRIPRGYKVSPIKTTDREVALAILETHVKGLVPTSTEILPGREEDNNYSSQVFETEPGVNVAAMLRMARNRGLETRSVNIGLDGRSRNMVVDYESPRSAGMPIARVTVYDENGKLVGTVVEITNSETGVTSYTIQINNDYQDRWPNDFPRDRNVEGDPFPIGKSFPTLHDANIAFGEYLASRDGVDRNYITDKPMRNRESLGPQTVISQEALDSSYALYNMQVDETSESLLVRQLTVESPRGGYSKILIGNETQDQNPPEPGKSKILNVFALEPELNYRAVLYLNSDGTYSVEVRSRTDNNITEVSSFDGDYASAREAYLEAVKSKFGYDLESMTVSDGMAKRDWRGPELYQNRADLPSPNTVKEARKTVLDRIKEQLRVINGPPVVINSEDGDWDIEAIGEWETEGALVAGVSPLYFVTDSNGKKWVLKRIISQDSARGRDFNEAIDAEIMTLAVYNAMGVPAGEMRRATFDGDDQYLISPYIDWDNSNRDDGISGLAYEVAQGDWVGFSADDIIKQMQQGFALDYLMNAFDTFFHPNNMIYGDDGVVYRIDGGGALLYEPVSKDAYGYRWGMGPDVDVEEYFDNWVNKFINSGHYNNDWILNGGFESTGREELEMPMFDPNNERAKQIVQETVFDLTDEAIDELAQIIRNPDDKEQIVRMLKARRDYLLKHFGLYDQFEALNIRARTPVADGEEPQGAPNEPDPLPEELVVPDEVSAVVPDIDSAPRIISNLNNPQMIREAIMQAYPDHTVLPNGDIKIATRDYKMRSRNDNRIFRYEAIVHKTSNDDFVAYVREYQIDENGNQIGEVTVGRFSDTAQGKENTLKQARLTLQGNSPGKGINGTNPRNWFSNSSDKESETVDPATGQLVPERFVSGRENVRYIGDTGIPETGDPLVDAFILSLANNIGVVPDGPLRQQFIDNLLNNWGDGRGAIVSRDNLEEIVERIVANRQTPGANLVPYPSRDGKTIVRVGDKVRHYWQGRTKEGTVMSRTRAVYVKPNGEYSYQDIVYVQFPGRNGWTKITTRNLEVLERSDGSRPLPMADFELNNAVVEPRVNEEGDSGSQLKWQEGNDGVAYLGGSGKTSEELEQSAQAKIVKYDVNGVQQSALRNIYMVALRNSDGTWLPFTAVMANLLGGSASMTDLDKVKAFVLAQMAEMGEN